MRMEIFNSAVLVLGILFRSAAAGAHETRASTEPETVNSVLRDLKSDIRKLQTTSADNSKLLDVLQGFLDAIAIGSDGDHRDPCGNFENTEYEDDSVRGWLPLTRTTCVKLLSNIQTMIDAEKSCENELHLGTDIEYPRVVTIDSDAKNEAFLRFIQSHSSTVTAAWIKNIGDYSKWENGSHTASRHRSCAKMRAMGNSDWVSVQCIERNSVICEKTVPLSYRELITQVVEASYSIRQLRNATIKMESLQTSTQGLSQKIQAALHSMKSSTETRLGTFDSESFKMKEGIKLLEGEMKNIINLNLEYWGTWNIALKADNRDLKTSIEILNATVTASQAVQQKLSERIKELEDERARLKIGTVNALQLSTATYSLENKINMLLLRVQVLERAVGARPPLKQSSTRRWQETTTPSTQDNWME